VHAGFLERGQHRHLDDVDAERLAGETVLVELAPDLAGDVGGDAASRSRASRCRRSRSRSIRSSQSTAFSPYVRMPIVPLISGSVK